VDAPRRADDRRRRRARAASHPGAAAGIQAAMVASLADGGPAPGSPRLILDRFRRQIRELCAVAVAGLPAMVDPRTGLFAFRVAGEDPVRSGRSLRYTAITLLGLERAERAGYALGVDVGRLYEAASAALPGAGNVGDVGLLLWASALTCRPLAEQALRDLHAFDDVLCRRGGDAVHTTELAWVVTGLAEALAADVGNPRDVRRRLDRAFAYLLGQRGASGLFCFARPRGGSARSPAALLRGELGFFDAQVYGIVACLARDVAVGDRIAREVARGVGERLLAHQRPLGQWGWHYNARTGALVDLYPVYAVHQDGMAPLALLPLERATGLATTAAVARGVEWLFGRNELGERLVDEERAVIWRSIRRRGVRRHVVYPLKAASLVRAGAALDLGARLAGPGALEVDRECRPSHLGFCLHALAELSTEALPELPVELEDGEPTLKNGETSAPGARARSSHSA
jgi:hypothetical protein